MASERDTPQLINNYYVLMIFVASLENVLKLSNLDADMLDVIGAAGACEESWKIRS